MNSFSTKSKTQKHFRVNYVFKYGENLKDEGIYQCINHLSYFKYLCFLERMENAGQLQNWRILFVAVFGIEFILYITGLIFRNHLLTPFVHFTRTMGTTWMLFLFYAIPFVWIS